MPFTTSGFPSVIAEPGGLDSGLCTCSCRIYPSESPTAWLHFQGTWKRWVNLTVCCLNSQSEPFWGDTAAGPSGVLIPFSLIVFVSFEILL